MSSCSWLQPIASSSHPLTPSPRVRTVVQKGELVYVRDGKTFKSLSKAVAGNPEAERAAQAYAQERRSGRRWYYWVYPSLAATFASFATSGFYAPAPASWENETVSKAFMTLASVSFLIALKGTAKHKDADTHLHDAINIFNEGVAQQDDAMAATGNRK